jgi:parvulin-like peptidyl-prolyl isomerase
MKRRFLAATALVLMFCAAGYAQSAGQSNLDWRQRFLGILPLVKPDPSDPVVATVDGVQITLAQVNSYSRTEARMLNATSTAENKAVWRDALDNLVNRVLLVREAKLRNITVADPEVAQRAREFQLTDNKGQAQQGPVDEDLMAQVRESMQIERMLDDEFKEKKVAPTDREVESYYNEHKDLFTKDPGEVRISHIALKLSPSASDADKEAVQKKIQDVYEQAQKRKDFAALAKSVSEDPNSAAKGGDLGYFRPGQLPPVVEKQAFATPVGKLSDIIASNIGFSFMKVTDRRGATYLALKEVRGKITLVLQAYKQEDVVKDILRRLRKKAKIEVRDVRRQALADSGAARA